MARINLKPIWMSILGVSALHAMDLKTEQSTKQIDNVVKLEDGTGYQGTLKGGDQVIAKQESGEINCTYIPKGSNTHVKNFPVIWFDVLKSEYEKRNKEC